MMKNLSMTKSEFQILLLITFSHQLLKLSTHKSTFQTNPLKVLYQQKNNDSFIITAANKEEIYKIISSLNINKSCELNSIPKKI